MGNTKPGRNDEKRTRSGGLFAYARFSKKVKKKVKKKKNRIHSRAKTLQNRVRSAGFCEPCKSQRKLRHHAHRHTRNVTGGSRAPRALTVITDLAK